MNRKKRWWIIGSVAALLAVGAVGLNAMGSQRAAGIPVSVGKVTTGALETRVLTSGTVVVEEKQRLYANVSGILREFAVQEGDVLKKGQVIGKIDTSDVESRMMAVEAQIELARANLSRALAGSEPEELAQERERVAQAEREYDSAKREYERIRLLHESGATTQQELEKAKGQMEDALSALNVARQQYALKQKGTRKEEIASLQAQLNSHLAEKSRLEEERVQSVLVAPADGTVIERAAENGMYVNKGTEILTMANLNRLLIEAEINESDVRKIKLGQAAVVEGSALGKEKLNARVIRISPVAVTTQSSSGQGERTRVKVTLEPSGDVSALKPGFHVDIDILVDKMDNALQVPIEAVQQEADGTTYVWVAENGVAKKRTVETGKENELFTEIKSGLNGDEQVILGPFDVLREDAPVQPSAEPGNTGI